MQQHIKSLIKGVPKGFKQLNCVIESVAKIGINCNYDKYGGEDSRILFYCGAYSAQHAKLLNECNGLIMDYKKWDVVCQPTVCVQSEYKSDAVDADLKTGKYMATEIRDGTTVNVYKYRGRWVISSARGIEMNNVKWNGVSYMEMLRDCGFDEKKLDDVTQYTLLFVHPKMHPYNTANELWYVSSVRDGKRVWNSPPTGIKPLPIVKCADMKSIVEICESKGSFGVMLRSADQAIAIKSRLMIDIETLMYDRALTTAAYKMGVDRTKYVVVVSALNPERFDKFVTLFPCYAEQARAVRARVLNVAQKIIARDYTADGVAMWVDEIGKRIKPETFTTEEQVVNFISIADYASLWLIGMATPCLST